MCPSHPWFPWLHRFQRRLLSGALGLFLAATAGGCATMASPLALPEPPVLAEPPPSPELVPVVRYGRYTLVELAPSAEQLDLLLQIVDVSTPETLHATVIDGLRHVLRRSGYQLCTGQASDALGTLPLPAAHYQLGPLTLRDALLTLAGPGWDLFVDDPARQVCFRLSAPTHTDLHPPQPAADPNPDAPVMPSPFEEAQP